MISIRASVLGGAAVLLVSLGSAQAADLFHGNGSIKDGGYSAGVAPPPSWYLRIDGSYAVHDNPVLVEGGRFDLTQRGFDSTWSFGGGLGYYFSSAVRGDLTYDHRFATNMRGTRDVSAVGGGQREFSVKSHLLLANLYYDFNRDGRFNPYLGVGLGGVHHKTSPYTVATTCGCTETIASGSSWDVAGALTAGLQMKLTRRASLDFGYRFLYMGRVKTGSVESDAGGPVGTIARDIVSEDLRAHEFRFGLRYNIR